ncbi:MAG: glycosyltransferase family 4 protein [Chlamydiales bacterium]
MRIGVDITPLSDQLTGVGNCVYYWLKELIPLRRDDEFFLYTFSPSRYLDQLHCFSNVTVRHGKAFSFSESIWGQTTLPFLARKDRLHLFFGPNQSIPFNIGRRVKRIIFIHDFTYRLYPKTVPRYRGIYNRLLGKWLYKKANAILTNSFGTMERLETLYHIKGTAVLPCPLKESVHPLPNKEIDAVLNEFSLTREKYVLMVGTVEPRKNISQTIEAYPPASLPLVVVGKKGWRMKEEPKARFLGFQPDEKVNALVCGAAYYLMPSLYEGFGMPLKEARSVGTPVICSDVPEMKEASEGDAKFIRLSHLKEDLEKCLHSPRIPPKKATYLDNKALARILSAQIDALVPPLLSEGSR